MGCDIHCFLEEAPVSYIGDSRKVPFWHTYASISLGRNYDVFAYMAHVRGNPMYGFPPRGLPDLASSTVFDYFYLNVVSSYDDYRKNTANLMHISEYSKLSGKDYLLKFKTEYDTYVQNPDYHTPSWLTLDELAQIRSMTLEGDKNSYHILDPVIAMMRSLEGSGTKRTRLVFFFDN